MDRPFPQPQPLEHGADLRHGMTTEIFVPRPEARYCRWDHHLAVRSRVQTSILPPSILLMAIIFLPSSGLFSSILKRIMLTLPLAKVSTSRAEGICSKRKMSLCRRPFGVDDHGQSQIILDKADILIIARIPHPGNGRQLPAFRAIRQLEHIELILIRHCNEQIRLLDPGLDLRLIAGAVAQHRLNVHGVDGVVQAL